MNRSLSTMGLAVALLLSSACVSQGQAQDQAYETKSNEGEVSFELTPRATDDGRLVVDLRVDTHSGDLSDLDLKALFSLSAGDETHRPVTVTTLRGHHSEGSITFEVGRTPESFTIAIGPLRGMRQQRFVWP